MITVREWIKNNQGAVTRDMVFIPISADIGFLAKGFNRTDLTRMVCLLHLDSHDDRLDLEASQLNVWQKVRVDGTRNK